MKTDFVTECGQSGAWKIDSFTVEEKDLGLFNMQLIMHGGSNRRVTPGTYFRLTRGEGFCKTVVMTNTPAEIYDLQPLFNYGTGNVLINGLGLGIAVWELLKKPDVAKITVIENSQDVINLTGKLFKDNPRVEIILADCFEYKPPKDAKYDFVWHDIWDAICSDNLEQMAKLHRKYAKRAVIQYSWCKDECRRAKHRYGGW